MAATPAPKRPDDERLRGVSARQPASGLRRRGGRVVLVVDDVSDTRAMYSLYLSDKGYRVPTASDGLSGIEAASRLQPDAIVMDLSMPGLDGIEATRRLKADPRTSHIPVVILTAYPMPAVQHGALEAGADGFLTKPCLPEHLEEYVRRLFGRGGHPRRPAAGAADATSAC